jgi:hypothetical protein
MKRVILAIGSLGIAALIAAANPPIVVNPQAGGSVSDGGFTVGGPITSTGGPITSNGVPLVGLPTFQTSNGTASSIGNAATEPNGSGIYSRAGLTYVPAQVVLDRIRFSLSAANQGAGTATQWALQVTDGTATCSTGNLPCNFDGGALGVTGGNSNSADIPLSSGTCSFPTADYIWIQAVDAGTGVQCATQLSPSSITAIGHLTDGGA